VKHREEVMQILEAFDLTRSYRDAGELAGCSPNTVEHWVARRDAGELTATTVPRPQLIDEFVGKLEEWMEASHGKVRADVAHDKLVAMGYEGSERTTRRAVATARKAYAEDVAGRDRSSTATRLAAAGFPAGKTFDAWDPALSSIAAPTQAALRTLEWIGRRENLVVCGPSGTGKTMFLEALGHDAVAAGHKVAWFSLETLGILVRRHRADDSVTRAIGRILRADLVVVDDIGLLPVATDAAEGLYRLVDAAYEKRSVAVSSNLHPSGFDEIMPKTLAGATVDRLLHHAHLCATTGDSIRLAQATTGKGVTPLT